MGDTTALAAEVTDQPFVTVKKKSRKRQLIEQLNAELIAAQEAKRAAARKEAVARAQLKEYKSEAAALGPVIRYDYERQSMTPLGFAELVLKDHGLIHTIKGHAFIHNKAATPWLKVQEANKVLKQLGLRQIVNSNQWRV